MSADGIPDDLDDALQGAARAPRLLVSSDYDGCVAPLVSRPEDARPNPASITAIVAAAELPRTTAAVVSGRELSVLAELSGLRPPVRLVGSHGSEFEGGFVTPMTDADRALLDRVTNELRAIAAEYPGTMVETKPASSTLHVRNAAPVDADAALERARRGPASWPGVEVTEGKAVIELAVIKTSKGGALDVLRDRCGADTRVIYLGDDVTDEKAFAHLRDGDVGVKVGSGATCARHRVTDPDDVAAVLDTVVAARRAYLHDH